MSDGEILKKSMDGGPVELDGGIWNVSIENKPLIVTGKAGSDKNSHDIAAIIPVDDLTLLTMMGSVSENDVDYFSPDAKAQFRDAVLGVATRQKPLLVNGYSDPDGAPLPIAAVIPLKDWNTLQKIKGNEAGIIALHESGVGLEVIIDPPTLPPAGSQTDRLGGAAGRPAPKQ